MWEHLRRTEPPTHPVCAGCGYDLAGLADGNTPVLCPECGEHAAPAQGHGPLTGRLRAKSFAVVLAPWVPVGCAGVLLLDRIDPGLFTKLAVGAALSGAVLVPTVVLRPLTPAERRSVLPQLFLEAVIVNMLLMPAAFLWATVLEGIGC